MTATQGSNSNRLYFYQANLTKTLFGEIEREKCGAACCCCLEEPLLRRLPSSAFYFLFPPCRAFSQIKYIPNGESLISFVFFVPPSFLLSFAPTKRVLVRIITRLDYAAAAPAPRRRAPLHAAPRRLRKMKLGVERVSDLQKRPK